FAGGVEDEGVGPGGVGLEQAERAGVHLGEEAQLRQVAAHQGEVVLVIETPQAADALQRALVAQLAAQRVGRVGRVGDHAAGAQDLHRLLDQPRLGVLRVNLEKLAHDISLVQCTALEAGSQKRSQSGDRSSGNGRYRPSSAHRAGAWKSLPTLASRPNSRARMARLPTCSAGCMPLTTSSAWPPAAMKSSTSRRRLLRVKAYWRGW